MLINTDVYEQITKQIDREQNASNAYMMMSLWAANQGFANVAAWFEKSSLEEIEHRNKMLKFLSDMGCVCKFGAAKDVSAPTPSSCLEAFQTALDLEIEVSGYIHKVASLIMTKNDWYTWSFWQFFIDEQLSSVRELTELVARAQSTGGNWLEFDESLEA